jgi:hypothetical protein
MAGRRSGGFRSGDLNEELGILLLKSFAAVAPVPRTEDTGIDAVATLLREDAKNLLIAENSFFVQLKSHSTRTVELKEHAGAWVKNLKLPFFIGSVSKEQGAIELYSTHCLTDFLIYEPPPLIRLHLDPGRQQRTSAEVWDAYIGPPIFTWTTAVFGDDNFPRRAYEVIKPHVEWEQLNIESRKVRYCRKISWKTGEPPVLGGLSFAQSGSPDEIMAASEAMAPALSALAIHIAGTRNEEARQVILSFFDMLRAFGIEPDVGGVYTLLGCTWDFFGGPVIPPQQ